MTYSFNIDGWHIVHRRTTTHGHDPTEIVNVTLKRGNARVHLDQFLGQYRITVNRVTDPDDVEFAAEIADVLGQPVKPDNLQIGQFGFDDEDKADAFLLANGMPTIETIELKVREDIEKYDEDDEDPMGPPSVYESTLGKCCGVVPQKTNFYRPRRCTRNATVKRGDKCYCFAHDPDREHNTLARDRRRRVMWMAKYYRPESTLVRQLIS